MSIGAVTDDGKGKAGDDVEYPPSLRNRPRCDQPELED